MDPETDARFKEAVERKKDEAREASHQQADAPRPSDEDPSQDVVSPREDTSRHGQVTADKWNQ